ncbi:MAG: hypothetical protein V1817_02845 [Candidatus Micrarchaeota archaeon]
MRKLWPELVARRNVVEELKAGKTIALRKQLLDKPVKLTSEDMRFISSWLKENVPDTPMLPKHVDIATEIILQHQLNKAINAPGGRRLVENLVRTIWLSKNKQRVSTVLVPRITKKVGVANLEKFLNAVNKVLTGILMKRLED